MRLSLLNSKQKNRLLWIFSSPWLIGFFGLVILFLSRPLVLKPYKLEVISTENGTSTKSLWYDIDNDGNSECVEFRKSEANPASVHLYDSDRYFIDVVNLKGFWIYEPEFTIGDAEGDGTPEIYSLVHRNDSLFITRNSFPGQIDISFERFVTTLHRERHDFTLSIHSLRLTDNNGDGSPELIFVLSAGFQRQPRAVFAWDIKSDELYRSPLSGANLPYDFEFRDINNDGVEEIFGFTTATDNYSVEDEIPFRDDHSWVMVFTKDLRFLFDPLKIEGRQTACHAIPYDRDGEQMILIKTNNQRRDGATPSLRLYSADGNKVLDEDIFIPDNRLIGKLFMVNKIPHLIITEPGSIKIIQLDGNLKQQNAVTINSSKSVFYGDLDLDGKEELFLISNDGKAISVYNDELREIAYTILPVPLNPSAAPVISHKFAEGKIVSTGIQMSRDFLNVRYQKSNDLHWRIMFYICSYGVFVLFIYALYGLWDYRRRRQEELKSRMMKLQLQTVMNQLNPHFTFNALNAVGSAIMKNDKDKAYDYLTRISEMIRSITKDAMLSNKTLGEELTFVKQYLSIQKFRFAGSLTWKIDVSPSVNLSVIVPKMLIHVFVENSFKHGVCDGIRLGIISIDIKNASGSIIISVKDNGPGLQKDESSKGKKSGNGLNILREYLQLFYLQYKREITFALENLSDEDGKVAGTAAIITIKN